MPMRFHLHVVDGDAAAPSSGVGASQTSAALLFAHMTLRCGHLHEVLVVSASTSPANVRAAAAASQQAQGTSHAAVAAAGVVAAPDMPASEDTQVLMWAAGLLKGEEVPAASQEGLPYVDGIVEGGGGQAARGSNPIVPYLYFKSSFAAAERSLRDAICAHAVGDAAAASPPPPYFDLIATTDIATYDYVVEYYQQQRMRHGGAVCKGRGSHVVGVVHVLVDDPSRAAQVLQRVTEMVLKRGGRTFALDTTTATEEEKALAAHAEGEEDEDEDEDEPSDVEQGERLASSTVAAERGGVVSRSSGNTDSWANHIDEAVLVFAQLFGVDILVSLL